MEAVPPPPLPPDLAELLYRPDQGRPPLAGIRGVLFDVYGTLFSSAAGDIGLRGVSRREELDALAREYTGDMTGADLEDYFRREVLRLHGESSLPYPEVRVEEIWAGLLTRAAPARFPCRSAAEREAKDLALRYELAVNPVFPMPGAGETLEILRKRGLRLGLISNAQFFTPLLFDAFFDASPEDLGFDPGLLIYSYVYGEAKPSPALFAPAVERLSSLGISPETCLYVGNDVLNDIYGAALSGFRTVLFAGDGRSLRLRGDMPLPREARPERIIRNLTDLAGMLL
jgi:putative hydrolase of the HAD superfamily